MKQKKNKSDRKSNRHWLKISLNNKASQNVSVHFAKSLPNSSVKVEFNFQNGSVTSSKTFTALKSICKEAFRLLFSILIKIFIFRLFIFMIPIVTQNRTLPFEFQSVGTDFQSESYS